MSPIETAFGASRMGWKPEASSPGTSSVIDEAQQLLSHLKLSQKRSRKGKEAVKDLGVWTTLKDLVQLVRRNGSLRDGLNGFEVVETYVLSWDRSAHRFRVIPFLADNASSSRRAAVYRLLRYFISPEAWEHMLALGADWFLIRSAAPSCLTLHSTLKQQYFRQKEKCPARENGGCENGSGFASLDNYVLGSRRCLGPDRTASCRPMCDQRGGASSGSTSGDVSRDFVRDRYARNGVLMCD